MIDDMRQEILRIFQRFIYYNCHRSFTFSGFLKHEDATRIKIQFGKAKEENYLHNRFLAVEISQKLLRNL